jgi:hypothetical protein
MKTEMRFIPLKKIIFRILNFFQNFFRKKLKLNIHLNLQDNQPPPLEEVDYLEGVKGLPPLLPDAQVSNLMLDDVEAVLRFLHSD